MAETEDPARHRPKVFGIGLSKTGTTSLARALEVLGFATADFINPCSEELLRERDIPLFDALTDTPIACQFEALYARYPDARFIYTKRPLESWETSFDNYFRHSLNLASFADMDRIINGSPQIKHGDPFRDIFNRLYVPYATPREAYLAHEKRVLSFFAERPQAQFLELDIFAGEGFPELARFLGVAAPDAPFPRENVKAAAPPEDTDA